MMVLSYKMAKLLYSLCRSIIINVFFKPPPRFYNNKQQILRKFQIWGKDFFLYMRTMYTNKNVKVFQFSIFKNKFSPIGEILEIKEFIVQDLMECFKNQGKLHRKYAFQILLEINQYFSSQPTLVDISVPDGTVHSILVPDGTVYKISRYRT